ncbi:unnamed protein product [Phytophthora fragariaefolia]|uniref:Unnamed protein product n=1 Tax=Phytophthora fragariaefolia TaxID=1490495 RepID=A0A9W6X116_9STRA|nr:unnamed protein product [Phytophthora fragariaefolia]
MVEGGKDSASMEEQATATTSSREVEGSSDIEACVQEESESGEDGTVKDAGVVHEEGAVAQRVRGSGRYPRQAERTTCFFKCYNIEVCNVFGLDNELVARTNNPLERFNRELNSRFPTPHPFMATFVTVIKTISQEYVRRVADVPRGRARRIPREVIQLPDAIDIPSDIESDVEEVNTADTGTVIIV